MTVEQLRTFLEQRQMTQRQLAELLGVSEEHMSRVLANGDKPLTPAMVGRFVMAFGRDVEQSSNGCEAAA
jgi:plasmid maintenance system antidote protein VapI